MSQADACELLNVSASGTHMLDGLPSLGTNPKTFLVADIEQRAAESTSLTEIAAVLGLHPTEALHLLQKRGIAEFKPGRWRRSVLVEMSDPQSDRFGSAISGAEKEEIMAP